MHNKIYIILVNYNGWKDTIECLESVFKSDYPNYQVIVCDNNSTDNSMQYIKDWAVGKLPLVTSNNQISKNTNPSFIKKPIPYSVIDNINNIPITLPQLILIQTGHNGGFAYANNIGIKFALQKNDFKYIWLLNNDIVVSNNSLSELVKSASFMQYAICGTKTFFYYTPEILQCPGGWKFNNWTASPQTISEEEALVGKNLSYIDGSSMLVSKHFIEEVGLMNEEYFLYFEEIDWSIRAHRKFKIGYADKSIVFHKQGASTENGVKDIKKRKSLISDFYSLRNRILFTYNYNRRFLPTVYLSFIIVLINRIKRKQYMRIIMIFYILMHPHSDINEYMNFIKQRYFR